MDESPDRFWTSPEGAVEYWPGVLSRPSPLQADEDGRTPGNGESPTLISYLDKPRRGDRREYYVV
jgi:hypothetical protein